MHPWWVGAVGYEVYVRSFADTDGDGIGDLAGVRERLWYLADLGIDVVWLTPFYPSPQADHGYDVADHLDVDPVFGSLAELERLLADAHELDLRVVIDLVPNHTSDRHPWFLDAVTGRDARHRDFYVWKDTAPDGGPPNNWVSHFGGPAWSFHEPTGQWYMHLFLPEQPDLDWAQPDVHDAFDVILTTWLERGVDGVRIDVAHTLVEDPAFRDNPVLPPDAQESRSFEGFAHVHDQDQEEVLDIYRRWRGIADAHDALLLGEVYLLDPDRLARYLTGDGLHLGFCFPALRTAWDAAEIRATLQAHLAAGGHCLAWPLSSHDDSRAATRFGGGELGARRALAYLTLLCCLPGMPFLYQGDELGLDDADLDPGAMTDPLALRNPGLAGRDPVRTPMLWKPGPGFGFTTGGPWLPFGTNRRDAHTVAAQLGDPGSHLERTRALLAVRHELPELASDAPVEWLDDDSLVVLSRDERVVVALHADATGEGPDHDIAPVRLALPEHTTLAFASDPAVYLSDDELVLPESTAAILTLDDG